ncbi:MAG: hypothetical protein H6Q15_1313 [Bacteroidetes bacterium]|nr:hypothetical protein [Bacteroidota bacterium]
MKTKNLLIFFLIIGINFSAFSQDEVTIKQVIKNSSSNPSVKGSKIEIIEIWTDIPITIKEGKENAIYLTGDINEYEKANLERFCVLKNNVFEINSINIFDDEEYKSKDLSKFRITLELADDVFAFFLHYNANVLIKKDLISDMHGVFNLAEKAQLRIEGEVKLGVVNISARENSIMKIDSIDAKHAMLTMKKGSTIDINGRIRSIEVMEQGQDSKLIGNLKKSSCVIHDLDPQLASDYLKKNGVMEKDSSISAKINTDTINKQNLLSVSYPLFSIIYPHDSTYNITYDVNKDSIVAVGYDNTKKTKAITLNYSFGTTNWAKKIKGIDNLFEGGDGAYTLNTDFDFSMDIGFRMPIANNINFKVGLGLEMMEFEFKNYVNVFSVNGENVIQIDNNPMPKQESRLSVNYVIIPIIIDWQFYKKWSMSFGAIPGINFSTKFTGFSREYTLNNIYTNEYWGSAYKNIKPIKLDVQYAIGSSFLYLYFKYSLTPIFKTGKEMDLYPYSVGVSIGI